MQTARYNRKKRPRCFHVTNKVQLLEVDQGQDIGEEEALSGGETQAFGEVHGRPCL